MTNTLAGSESPHKTPAEAADWLRVRTPTMAQWRWKGGGPRFIRLSARKILYRLEDLEAFTAERTFVSTSDQGQSVTTPSRSG